MNDLQLAGSAVFALSGALAAARAQLDALGMTVVALITATGGGLLSDMLLGELPPAALTHWQYSIVALLAAAVAMLTGHRLPERPGLLVVLDAGGLALSTVTGVDLALDHHLPVFGACAVGLLSGVAGGIFRDLLLGTVPLVLRQDVYALAALVGAATVCAAQAAHVSEPVGASVGAAVIFAVRLTAAWRRWSLPKAPKPAPSLPSSLRESRRGQDTGDSQRPAASAAAGSGPTAPATSND